MRTSTTAYSITGSDSPPLDYLQPSPVRGQLEPYREKTRVGWRFLQCTDTPDELKVGPLSQICVRKDKFELVNNFLGVAAPTHCSDVLPALIS